MNANNTLEKIPFTVRLPKAVIERVDQVRGRRSRQFVIEGLINGFADGEIDVPEVRPQAVAVIEKAV